MNKFSRLTLSLSALTLTLFAGACASGPSFGTSRPQAPIKPEFYSGDLVFPKTETIEDALYRSRYQRLETGYLQVTLIPQTKPLVNSEIHKRNQEEAFKNKLSPEAERKLLDTALGEAEKKRSKQSCFEVKAQASSINASETKYWYGKVIIDGGDTLPLSFSEFNGFTETTTHAYSSEFSNTVSVYDTKMHYLYSTACTAKPFDLSKDFTVEIEPRYQKNIKPFQLRWGKPLPSTIKSSFNN